MSNVVNDLNSVIVEGIVESVVEVNKASVIKLLVRRVDGINTHVEVVNRNGTAVYTGNHIRVCGSIRGGSVIAEFIGVQE